MKALNMQGVVMWADSSKGTAVIWCDDQGELAYVEPGQDEETRSLLVVGAAVSFDLDSASDVRRARNLRGSEGGSRSALASILAHRLAGDAKARDPATDTLTCVA